MTTINNLTKHDFKIGNWVKANDGQFGFNELFRIEDFFADKDGVLLAVLDDGDCYPLSFLEHASEAEIKAGHRIDDTTDHVTTQLCIGCGSPDLHKGGEIKEPKMCLDCFAEMVGFTRTNNGFIESDEVTDIRNHVSPSTRVVDL